MVENSWPKEMVKNVRLKKFASLRLTINHVDFDVEALARFFKEKATKDAHMTIFIDMQMDYQTINKTIAEKFEPHFKRIFKAPNNWQWIFIRFNEISEEDMLIRETWNFCFET
uniref:Uncharacterized protein n=1 Tax=Panagrolaimus sp. PS1159 TaxID=55785 RepID=A0AC35F6Z4_9BILA